MQIDTFASSSKGNLYRINDGKTPLLVECGLRIEAIRRALDFRLPEIKACLVSHSHADHSKGVRGIIAAGIDCYMSEESASAMFGATRSHRVHVIESLKQFYVGSWKILPFSVCHDIDGTFGFLARSGEEKLLYVTDTAYVHFRFRGLTHIMIECNYSKHTLSPDLDPVVRRRLIRSHFGLENVKEFIKANDMSLVREIHLLHLSDGNSDEGMFRASIQKLTGVPVYVAGGKGK